MRLPGVQLVLDVFASGTADDPILFRFPPYLELCFNVCVYLNAEGLVVVELDREAGYLRHEQKEED